MLPEDSAQLESLSPTGRDSQEFREMRVIVVDDENDLKEVVGLLLESQGYAVTLASSGREALSVWEEKQGRFALLITDLLMPDMDGLQLTAEVLDRHQGCKVIVMSAYVRAVMEERLHQVGLEPQDVSFIQKPFPSHKLFALVQTCLDT